MKFLRIVFSILAIAGTLHTAKAQLLGSKATTYTRADTLRGTLNANRTWWDVLRYNIHVTPDFTAKTIVGETVIGFKVVGEGQKMQIDLQSGLEIDSVFLKSGNKKLLVPFVKDAGNTWLLTVSSVGIMRSELTIKYHGKPREAVRPPWDGGWVWKKDVKGRPWMSVACQGTGASVWYPCKDHQSDEPDNGASLSMTVSDTLVAVANGRLISQTKEKNLATYTWEVKNPINNYTIIPYIGKYVHFGEAYMGEKGKLDCDYWVLDYNFDKAKEQFKQVPKMLKAFEYWFGPYPFYEDSYKLVESPYLGMEHQSAVAYGNGYQNGYLGRDRSGTGEGLKWDYIIIHESGHEWFANNVTTKDIADMWVHEGFTCYSETLFTDYWFGKEAGNKYLQGLRPGIRNDKPIIGPYGINEEGSGDMYIKGATLLHTIRQIVGDEKFRQILRGLNQTFYHKTVTTDQVEAYISKQATINFSKVFDQFLRTTQIPVLEWKYEKGTLYTKWTNCIAGFDMEVRFADVAGNLITIKPSTVRNISIEIELPADKSKLWDKNFYLEYKEVK